MRFSLVLVLLLPLLACDTTDPGPSENTLSFTGSVRLDGEPYEGAEVEFFQIVITELGATRNVIATTTSDSEGVYHIAGRIRCTPGEQLSLVWNLEARITPFELVDVNSGRLRCVEEVQVFDFEFILNQ